jgi:hypothetical protein
MKTKGKTKREDLEVKKIDAVDIGADQKANILIKKRGGAEEPKGNFFKRFFNAFCDSLGVNSEDVRKSMEDEATSFDDVMNEKKIYDVRDQIWNACNSLEQSIVSILLDKECEDKQAAIAQSIDQFKAFSDDASKSWIKLERAATDKEDTVVADDFEIAKMQEVIEKSCDPETINKEKETEVVKENNMAFDISNMTEEEKKEALKALQADASKESTEKRFNSGAGEDQIQEAVNKAMSNAMEDVTKNFSDMMAKIMEPIQKRAEEAEQKSLEEVAKKYELLGTKAEDLVPVLKSMKETSDEAYNNFIASMDNNLAVIQKSGLFEEIGKSGGAHTGNNDTEGAAKMNAKVAEIKKSMPNLTDAQAQDIVMQNDPELRAMFDK